MIRLYTPKNAEGSEIDLKLLPSGELVPNLASTNRERATHILIVPDDVGMTARQYEILIVLARTQHLLLWFSPPI